MSAIPSLRLEIIQQQAEKPSESYRVRLSFDLLEQVRNLAAVEHRTVHNMMINLLIRGIYYTLKLKQE